jgi:translation initiation factor IF-3
MLVLTEDGENLGLMTKAEAVSRARAAEMDLVLIAPQAEPPVAKILDFKKFLYNQNKKKSQIKAKSKKSELKEFRFGPTIGQGDLNTRIERSREFLKVGNRVKITAVLKGREGMYPEVAMEKIKKLADGLSDIAKMEENPRRMGNQIHVIFVAK